MFTNVDDSSGDRESIVGGNNDDLLLEEEEARGANIELERPQSNVMKPTPKADAFASSKSTSSGSSLGKIRQCTKKRSDGKETHEYLECSG